MTNLLELYDLAEQQHIDVDWFPLLCCVSLSMPLPEGDYCIAIDPWKVQSLEEETVLLGHELGHCMTGSFYNKWAACDVRRKHENQADKWEIQQFVNEEALDDAIADGCTEMWELAERFGVTQEFMEKVVCWYTHGNLAVEAYMTY